MAKPSPTLPVMSAWSAEWTKRVNRRASVWAGTPGPSSLTTTENPSPSGRPSTVMLEPPWRTALEMRLRST